MRFRFWLSLCVLCLCAGLGRASSIDKIGLGDPGADVPLRLTSFALGVEVGAEDERVSRTRNWLARAAQATGEEENAVAAACVRMSRYLFDVSRAPSSPLEVLEVLAIFAPPGRPLAETTQRYFELRVKRKLDHGAAIKVFAEK